MSTEKQLMEGLLYRPSNERGKPTPSLKFNNYKSNTHIYELAEPQPSTVSFRSAPEKTPKKALPA